MDYQITTIRDIKRIASRLPNTEVIAYPWVHKDSTIVSVTQYEEGQSDNQLQFIAYGPESLGDERCVRFYRHFDAEDSFVREFDGRATFDRVFRAIREWCGMEMAARKAVVDLCANRG